MMAQQESKCYGCGGNRLEHLHTFPDLASCGTFLEDGKAAPRSSIQMTFCQDCTLTQASHDLKLSDLYSESYGYRSSLNPAMVLHLQQKAKRLIHDYEINSIVDVGSNDGTFLNCFSAEKRIGVDPSISCNEHDPGALHIGDFFPCEKTNRIESGSIDLVTAISMFYDLPDIQAFLTEVVRLLSENGVFHIELSYVQMMYSNNSFDTICHEHLEYYSIKSLRNILALQGLRIAKIGFNQANGGSLWMDISKSLPECPNVEFFIFTEDALGVNNGNAFKKMMARVDQLKEETTILLDKYHSKKLKIHGLGASTKGNMILQYFGIDRDQINKIQEINSVKFGLSTPGTNIPIVEEFSEIPDAFFVLPWHFKEQFLRESRYKNCKLIFPLPNLELRA